MPEALDLERVRTPIGTMLILTDEQHLLCAADWEDHRSRMLQLVQRFYGTSAKQLRTAQRASPAKRALEAYFSGDLRAIETLQVSKTNSGTAFQKEVWAALRLIPAGRTTSYGVLAAKLGRPKAVRAVGAANGANPISVVVPCHRVLGSDGTLTGYGGGLKRKRWLLAHEGVEVSLDSDEH